MIPVATPIIDEEEIQEVIKVLKSGFIAQGPRVAEFEEKFAAYVGTEHAVATSSGTTALHLALLAAGVGKGDEVITTPFSFAATANAALYVGATPVFADIDPLTYNIDPERIEELITPSTRAIIPVHLYGQPADMDPIMDLAADHDILVIEDAAQAHGAEYHGRKVGSMGDAACFSFYPTKNITTGEGGIITTDDDEIAEMARILRAHGETERYRHTYLGYNFRMTDISAAIGIAQLGKLEEFNSRRIENAAYLTSQLEDLEGVSTPHIAEGVRHVFHQYTLRVPGSRDELMGFLNERGVGTGIHYPRPIYRQELYQRMGFDARCPVSEAAAAEVLSIPVHPALTSEELETVADTVREFFE